MAEGRNAADSVNQVVKGIGQVGEDVRKNINSFADNVLKPRESNEPSGIANRSAKPGEVHPDAKALGSEIGKGIDAAGTRTKQ